MPRTEKLTTPKFRVAFPHVFEKQTLLSGKEKYSICMIFEKNTDITSLKNAINKIAKEHWGGKIPRIFISPFKDGKDKLDKEGNIYDGFKDATYINVTSEYKPGIVDQNLNPLFSDEEFYAGCYARATIFGFTYDKPKCGASFILCNLQFLGEGEPFSGKVTAENDFEAVEAV